MMFLRAGLRVERYAPGRMTMWRYVTASPIKAVEQSAYWTDAGEDLTAGDVIRVESLDQTAWLFVVAAARGVVTVTRMQE